MLADGDIMAFYSCRDNLFHSNLSHAFRVLKYVTQPAHSRIYLNQAANDIKLALSFVQEKYSSKCSTSLEKCVNYDPVFSHCQFGHNAEDNQLVDDNVCSLFRRTFGIKGISYEFNPSVKFLDLYSDKNTYNKMFNEEIVSQDQGDQDNAANLSSENTLDFFIHPDSLEKYVFSQMTPPMLAVHHPTTVPTTFMKLQRGYR